MTNQIKIKAGILNTEKKKKSLNIL